MATPRTKGASVLTVKETALIAKQVAEKAVAVAKQVAKKAEKDVKRNEARFRLIAQQIDALPTKLEIEDMIALKMVDMPKKTDLEGLAKTSDIDEVLRVFKNMDIAATIIKGGASWSFKALLVIAGLVAALTTIFGGWKVALAWLIGKPL